jgi:lipopolysaccharide transport system permease protein
LSATIQLRHHLGTVLGVSPGEWSLARLGSRGHAPFAALQQVLAVALGVFLGVINVYFRDVAQVVGVLLQFWFWLTPIVYPLAVVPAGIQGLMAQNPASPLVAAYQGIVVEHR